jgi:hypothetical protein
MHLFLYFFQGTQLLNCFYYTSNTGYIAVCLRSYTSPHMIRLLDTQIYTLYTKYYAISHEIRLLLGRLTSPWQGANYQHLV